ncbi:LysR family transcriptional regulator [Planotetraspora phitsanulokensis]|uniref:LysR family transcriptional regulator n=1 Tax=Planotetraspora phitsanulokensis TaxID=575192 RepID=A0A8J3U0N6_9ACTN|nr:LysR family transcriptional regulator [Planotetraspora phitsanulokensis]GII36159.1 LysR family transcriptional regulator [Planotetraspora phitsanulokensis]
MDRPELGLQQLHAFAVLAEELHFGRAAERLGIAQPPFSQQIRRLEGKVGHPLFTRGPGRVTLTPAGHELLPAARRALDEVATGLDAARRIGDGQAGRIRIGFSASLALTLLPTLLGGYRDRYPGVDVEIREMTTAPQVAALHEHLIDIGLLREPPNEPGLATETILSEEFVAVLPAAHPLAGRRVVSVTALADEPFVLLPRDAGPALHDQILGLCRDAGFEPRLGQHAVEWQTVSALVEAGFGVSLAPASIRRIRLKGVAYRRIEPDAARTAVAMAWRRDDPNPLVARFLATARNEP